MNKLKLNIGGKMKIIRLDESNYIDIINSYDKKHWQPLLDLIPEIKSTVKFGEMVCQKDKEGEEIMPYYALSPVVEKFLSLVYELNIIVVFKWFAWNEGKKIFANESFDYTSIDIPTKCKLITVIVRNDRFCDGVLVSNFQSGVILKLLLAINKQLGL